MSSVFFMRRTHRHTSLFVLTVLIMSCGGVYIWHTMTLMFAERLATHSEPIAPSDGHRFRFTDIAGIQTVVWDDTMQDPAYYESFIRSVGASSRFGIGHVRDPSTGLEYWLGMSLLQTAFIMVGAFCVTSQLPRMIRSVVPSLQRHSPISFVGIRLGAMLIPIGLPVLWYTLYPRERIGQGVVEMHATLQYAGPFLAAFLGLLAATLDLNVERIVRLSKARCPRCHYPTSTPNASLCLDCGFEPNARNVARRQLWSIAKLSIAIVTMAMLVVTARIVLTSDRGLISSEFLTRWLLLRPMSS